MFRTSYVNKKMGLEFEKGTDQRMPSSQIINLEKTRSRLIFFVDLYAYLLDGNLILALRISTHDLS